MPISAVNTGWKIKKISASPQQTEGDPKNGFNYLIYGDYIGSGIPYEVFEKKS